MILASRRNLRRTIARLYSRGRRDAIPVEFSLLDGLGFLPLHTLAAAACLKVGRYPRKPRARRPE